MLRVLTKVATYVDNVWHAAGEEIIIAEHHFSEEVHTLLETLGIEKEIPPVERLPSPPPAPAPAAPEPAAPDPEVKT